MTGTDCEYIEKNIQLDLEVAALRRQLKSAENERDSVRNALEGSREELSISRGATSVWKQTHDKKCNDCKLRIEARALGNEVASLKNERAHDKKSIATLEATLSTRFKTSESAADAAFMERERLGRERDAAMSALRERIDRLKTMRVKFMDGAVGSVNITEIKLDPQGE